MNLGARLRNSMYHNRSLWIMLWLLILINGLTFLALAGRFSYPLLLVFIGLGIMGIFFIHTLAYDREAEAREVEVENKVQDLLREIKPLCEEAFAREVKEVLEPLLDEMHQEFEENLRWFWQAGQDFSREVEKHINEIRPVLKIVRSGNEERYKLINKLGENVDMLSSITGELDILPVRNSDDLERFLQNKAKNLQDGLHNEKEIFYDYIYKLLREQVKDQPADQDITQYFDVYKLVEQFTGILQKSLENRVKVFREEMAGELADYAADLVGKMQKLTQRIMNILEEINDNLTRLIESGKNESTLVLKRLNELNHQSSSLQEKAEEIMLTLAWHDVLLERRWQKLKEELYLLKDKIGADDKEELLSGIKQIVEQEVPGISYAISNPRQAVWFKNLLEAEILYQLYQEKKLSGIIDNGAYPLLLYAAVLEDLVLSSIRIGEEGIRLKRDLKEKVQKEDYAELYQRIKQMVENEKEGLKIYLEDIFPRMFHSFCHNPYVRTVPDNIALAAWFLFIELACGDSKEKEDIYLLTGYLLAAWKLRNRYIDPLQNEPQGLENEEEIDYMRYICYRSVALIIAREIESIARLKFMAF